ncbi:MAG: hypothetical protein MJ165_01855 [Alphaproteobacteria bacterium]|nr:hypothetical protein [Alphaproteobacteria bacterium]
MMQEQTQTLTENKEVKTNVATVAVGVHKQENSNNVHLQIPSLSKSFRDVLSDTYTDYRRANKEMLKQAVDKYVRVNVRDAKLLKFMLNSVKYENVNMGFENSTDWVGEYNEDGESCSAENEQMTMIRRDYRWFNDLMLYLNDKYSERQLLKTEFFKTMNNRKLMQDFTKNTEIIESLSCSIKQEYANAKQTFENSVQDNVKTNNK